MDTVHLSFPIFSSFIRMYSCVCMSMCMCLPLYNFITCIGSCIDHCSQVRERFRHRHHKDVSLPFDNIPASFFYLVLNCWQPRMCPLFSIIFSLLRKLHNNEILQCITFSDWLFIFTQAFFQIHSGCSVYQQFIPSDC